MTYYQIIETDPIDWQDTELILDTFHGVHYGTVKLNEGIYRKFVVKLSPESLLMAKLSLSHRVSIEEMTKRELERLGNLGYIK